VQRGLETHFIPPVWPGLNPEMGLPCGLGMLLILRAFIRGFSLGYLIALFEKRNLKERVHTPSGYKHYTDYYIKTLPTMATHAKF